MMLWRKSSYSSNEGECVEVASLPDGARAVRDSKDPNGPSFQPLKGDALLTEQHAQALMADVVDHPLSHQELRQLRQAPGGKRQAMLGRPGLGDLLDLPPLHQGELRRPATLCTSDTRS